MFSLHDIGDFLLIALAVAAAGSVSTGLFLLVVARWWRKGQDDITESADYAVVTQMPVEPSITTYSTFAVMSQFGFVGGGKHMIINDGHGGSVTFRS